MSHTEQWSTPQEQQHWVIETESGSARLISVDQSSVNLRIQFLEIGEPEDRNSFSPRVSKVRCFVADWSRLVDDNPDYQNGVVTIGDLRIVGSLDVEDSEVIRGGSQGWITLWVLFENMRIFLSHPDDGSLRYHWRFDVKALNDRREPGIWNYGAGRRLNVVQSPPPSSIAGSPNSIRPDRIAGFTLKSCAYFVGNQELMCTANPFGPCEGCPHFESTQLT